MSRAIMAAVLFVMFGIVAANLIGIFYLDYIYVVTLIVITGLLLWKLGERQ